MFAEFVVSVSVAAGAAAGFVLLGAAVAVLPALCLLYCRRKAQPQGDKAGVTNQAYN